MTINRPEAKNAFDCVSARAMHAAMDLLDAEDDLFVGVITGAGGVFPAGADLKAVARGERAVTGRGGFGMLSRPSRKTPIAAVEGCAVGGGLFRLPRRIPYHVAMALALTGAFQDAEFSRRHGLVNRITEPG